MKSKNTLVPETNRTVSIDILRGFALLGILLVNMPTFNTPVLYMGGFDENSSNLDSILSSLVELFAQGSFYPLFAFMFGYGAIIIAENSRRKGISFPKLFSKRLAILLVIGLIHAFLLWSGDILLMYALTGFLFILFYKLSGKALLGTGIALYIVSAFLPLLQRMPEEGSFENTSAAAQKSIESYRDGTFSEIFSQRFTDWMSMNTENQALVMAVGVLGLMLMGAAFAKLQWISNASAHKPLVKRLLFAGLILGFGIKFLGNINMESMIFMVFQQIGGPLISLFYMMGIILLVELPIARKLLQPLSFVGRLSMTNYLLQSTVMTFIFYSYGFGLYNSISYTTGFMLVFAFFALQVLFSKWWASQYRYGPVEYVWRWGTYGKKPIFKKDLKRDVA